MAKFRLLPRRGKHICASGKVLVPGDVIDCNKKELGNSLDKFECLEPGKLEEEENPKPKVGLRIVEVGGGLYNIVNEITGASLNDDPMSLERAKELAGHDSEVEKIADKEEEEEELEEKEEEKKPVIKKKKVIKRRAKK